MRNSILLLKDKSLCFYQFFFLAYPTDNIYSKKMCFLLILLNEEQSTNI